MTRNVGGQQPMAVLHLEDNENDHLLVKAMLEKDGLSCSVRLVRDLPEYLEAIQTCRFDLIISDYSLPAFDGHKALVLAQQHQPEVPFLLFSGTMGEDVAVESLKNGAIDYVVKQRPQRLAAAVRRALKQAEEQAARKQAEEKIREQAEIIDNASDAIMVRDLQDKVLYWNRGAERLYGWTAADAQGRNIKELYTLGTSAQIEEARKQTVEAGEWHGILQQTTQTGEAIFVSSRWTLVRDAAGQPKAILVINTNITEVRKLEAQLLRAQRLESIGALAGGIAHDLNNILAPILMTVDLIEPEIQSEESKQMVKTMQECARRGADLVKQILLFARGTSEETGLFQLKPLVAETAKLVKDTFPRNIRIETNLTRDLPYINGNPGQIHQVLMNLCVNARDAMPNGGVLSLTLEAVKLRGQPNAMSPKPVSGEFVVLSVSDTGHGMEPELLGKIFDPFFTTKPEGAGTGLGLSTVKSIVQNHSGFIEVFSRPGQGAAFKVFLPAAPKTGVVGVSQAAAPPSGNGELILVADDELAISEIMRNTLESFNYQVMAARSGAEALALFDQDRARIRAVVADVELSPAQGQSLIQNLRDMDGSLAIVGITAMNAQGAVGNPQELQVQGLLKKPYTIRDLLTTLHTVLAAKS